MTKRRTWLDYALWIVAALVIVLFAYLGYSVWAQRAYEAATSPAARAVANLEKIVRQKPQMAGARIELARAYVAAGRDNDAIDQYQEALRLDKENPNALEGLGEIAMRKQQWSTAEGYWRRVIDKLQKTEFSAHDDRLEAAYYYLGAAFVAERKYEDGIPYLKEASRIRPDASDTHYALSVAYRGMGSDAKSEDELKAALAFDPNMPEANYDMGEILLARGDVAGAAERFRLSADRAPGTDKPRLALQKLGTVDEHLKQAQALLSSKPASATAEARIAVAIDPQSVPALTLLAGLYDKAGQKDKALAAYQKLQALVSDDASVTAAVARLKNGGK